MNRFKSAISSDTLQIGLWQALANPYSVEICAGAGFDWLLLDGEHAPNDIPLLLAQLQACMGSQVEPVIRVPNGDVVIIKQVLDIGARTLLVPMVEDRVQTEMLVRATRYPPLGVRGVGSAIGRASRWNREPTYLAEASEDICLLVQVETHPAIQNIEAIATTEGVDGLFIGPADLAASMGHLGDPGHPEVQDAIGGAIGRIRKCNKAAGIIAIDLPLAQHYLALGARFVAVGADVTILARGAEAIADRFKNTAVIHLAKS
jgi:4-hydroxy-2-oxoheptanedioate aldolase